jgi:hypothetical protein
MSALGHKRAFAVQNGMSALPPKADICSAQAHVRFVPKADIANLIDHLIGCLPHKLNSAALCLLLLPAVGDKLTTREFGGGRSRSRTRLPCQIPC